MTKKLVKKRKKRDCVSQKKETRIIFFIKWNYKCRMAQSNSSVNNSGNSYNFKVVLLGEGCVGKTSLVLRYVEDKFNAKHITTLQVHWSHVSFSLFVFDGFYFINSIIYNCTFLKMFFRFQYKAREIVRKVINWRNAKNRQMND